MSTQVLIIDPNIPFMVSIKQALEGTGEFEVSVSASGVAAQEALRQARHDIAVIDFNVADMDVLELLAQLRRLQPDLHFLLSYADDEQASRAPHLGVHGVIAKPYTARELILQLYRAMSRRAPGETAALRGYASGAPDTTQSDTSRAAPAPFIPEPDEDAQAAEDEAPFEAARFAGAHTPPDAAETRTPTDEDLRRLAQTHVLRDDADPADTNTLREWQDTDRTGTLPKTDALDNLIDKHGWIEGVRTPPFLDEPRAHDEDTPTVPTQDLNGVRQFLATDAPMHDPAAFGEVLDALAQTPPTSMPHSPDDQAFHELVDSLRTPTSPARRGTLEDLLTSLGTGSLSHETGGTGYASEHAPDEDAALDYDSAPPGNPLDYVLDSIRRGLPAQEDNAATDESLDDTTIGEVIGGLFDPSFESVLAAMAGEDVSDDDYAEPTYSERSVTPAERLVPDEADQIGVEDFDDAGEMPDWLDGAGAPLPAASPGVTASEPPVSEDDSSHYPATAALHAVTRDDQPSGFSLNELLSQIEQQLPPARAERPRLRPLPSWEENASPEEAEQLRQVFPPGDEWEHGDIEEIFSAPPTREPENWIERVEDTGEPGRAGDRPAAPEPPLPDERLGAGWDTFADEPAGDAALPADFDQLLDQPDDAEPPDRDEPDRMALELDLDEDLIEAVHRAEALPPASAPPIEDEDTLAAEISEAFYEGVRQTDYTWDQADTPAGAPPEPGWDAAPEPVDEQADERADERAQAYADPWGQAAAPEEEPLIALPVEEAARRLTAEPQPEAPDMDEDEAARLAQIALQLTQFSLESSAQATVLTYEGDVIAQAGDLPGPALERLERAIETAWSTSPPEYDSLTRFVTLPGVGEFLLFSRTVAEDMVLSMVFNANTPVRTIRRQARRLSESLALVPEQAAAPEPPAAITRPARPTDLRAPEGLRTPPAPREQVAPAAPAPRADKSYAGYTLLWLPWDPRLELSGAFGQALAGWIETIAAQRAWDIDALAVETDYVQVALKVPQKNLPDGVIHTLFDETARRAEEHFPELINSAGRLWANGYYVVTPPRALTDREIGRFITVQRQAQTG